VSFGPTILDFLMDRALISAAVNHDTFYIFLLSGKRIKNAGFIYSCFSNISISA
jgi:hypothetical protein